jgi:hypothetical protein
MRAIDLANQGVGAYQPFVNAAGAGIAQGQNLAQTGARGIASINMAPEFAQALSAQQQGLEMAGQMPGYAATAGLGYGSVAQGMDTVGGAVDTSRQYTQANLQPSQALLGEAAQLTAGVNLNLLLPKALLRRVSAAFRVRRKATIRMLLQHL